MTIYIINLNKDIIVFLILQYFSIEFIIFILHNIFITLYKFIIALNNVFENFDTTQSNMNYKLFLYVLTYG